MPLIPNRFLIRVAHTCPYFKAMPQDDDVLVDLPSTARLNQHPELDGTPSFAEVRIAWNEFGIGIQAEVQSKKPVIASTATVQQPFSCDGLTLWLDTRDARASHRASRTCHQFHLLVSGGGANHDEPAFVQTKINRALQDAPLCDADDVRFVCERNKKDYRMAAFLPAAVLSGFDPEQFPRWGISYHVRDHERGDQFLSVNAEFPIADDPSLWEVLDLSK